MNNAYLQLGELSVVTLEKEITWFDTGNACSLLDAACAIRDYRRKTGEQVGCLEQTAYRNGLISREKLLEVAERIKMSDYGKYLMEYANGDMT